MTWTKRIILLCLSVVVGFVLLNLYEVRITSAARADSLVQASKSLDSVHAVIKIKDDSLELQKTVLRQHEEKLAEVLHRQNVKVNHSIRTIREAVSDSLKPLVDSLAVTLVQREAVHDSIIAVKDSVIEVLTIQVAVRDTVIHDLSRLNKSLTAEVQRLSKKKAWHKYIDYVAYGLASVKIGEEVF